MVFHHQDVVNFDGPFEIDGQEVPVIITELVVDFPERGPKCGQWNTCVQCGGKFKGRNQLLKHQRSIHPATNSGTVLCRFPSCTYVCHRIQQLADHMKQMHLLEVKTTEHSFRCEEDFKMWKEDYEITHNSQYRLTSSKFKSTCRYFNCNRSGFYNPKEDKQRKAKSQGTSKMNGHCISGMVVKTDEFGAVHVLFSETHYGHDSQVNHLRLGARTRDCMKQQLRAGLSEDFVCAHVNKILRKEKKPPISKKDVQNVAYTLQNQILDSEFSFKGEYSKWNVDSFKLNLKDNICFHKAQGERRHDCKTLQKDDFMLCCMTDKQLNNLHRLADRGLCVEVCLGSNNGALMCLVMVFSYLPSKKDASILEEVPLAWCLSNVDKYRIKKAFFESIRKCCKTTVRPPFLLTNEWSESYEAWCSAFKDGPDHVMSPWSVDKAMVFAVTRYVLGRDQRQIILGQIRALLKIEDQSIFHDHLQYLIQEFGSMAEYMDFFNKYFTDRFVSCGNFKWARAYYPDHKMCVDNYCLTVEKFLSKIWSYCSKTVGRCANLLMCAYTLRRHHLDATFVRRRKRMKREDLARINSLTAIDVLRARTIGRLYQLKRLLCNDHIPCNTVAGFADRLKSVAIDGTVRKYKPVKRRLETDHKMSKKFKSEVSLDSCTSSSARSDYVPDVFNSGNCPTRRLLPSGSVPNVLKVNGCSSSLNRHLAAPSPTEHNNDDYLNTPLHSPTFLHPVVISEEVVPATEEEACNAALEMSFEESFIMEDDDSIGLVVKVEPPFRSEAEPVIEHVIYNEEMLEECSVQVQTLAMDEDEIHTQHIIFQEDMNLDAVPTQHAMLVDSKPTEQSMLFYSDPTQQSMLVQSDSDPTQQSMFVQSDLTEQSMFVHSDSGPTQQSMFVQSDLDPTEQSMFVHSDSDPTEQSMFVHSDSGPIQQSMLVHSDSGPTQQSMFVHSDSGPTQHWRSEEVQDHGAGPILQSISEEVQGQHASAIVAIKVEPDDESQSQMFYVVTEDVGHGHYEAPQRRRRSARAC